MKPKLCVRAGILRDAPKKRVTGYQWVEIRLVYCTSRMQKKKKATRTVLVENFFAHSNDGLEVEEPQVRARIHTVRMPF